MVFRQSILLVIFISQQLVYSVCHEPTLAPGRHSSIQRVIKQIPICLVIVANKYFFVGRPDDTKPLRYLSVQIFHCHFRMWGVPVNDLQKGVNIGRCSGLTKCWNRWSTTPDSVAQQAPISMISISSGAIEPSSEQVASRSTTKIFSTSSFVFGSISMGSTLAQRRTAKHACILCVVFVLAFLPDDVQRVFP